MIKTLRGPMEPADAVAYLKEAVGRGLSKRKILEMLRQLQRQDMEQARQAAEVISADNQEHPPRYNPAILRVVDDILRRGTSVRKHTLNEAVLSLLLYDFPKAELEEAIDGIMGLTTGFYVAIDKLRLSNQQLRVFLRETPNGAELWRAFTAVRDQHKAVAEDESYGFSDYMVEILYDTDHRVLSAQIPQ